MAATVMPQIQNSVSEFIAQPRKMLIGGKWVDAVSGKTFETYNPATGDVLHTLKGHHDPIHCVTFSPDGRDIASASSDATILIWVRP